MSVEYDGGVVLPSVSEAVDEIIANFKSLKPPFVCPIDGCAKPCLGLMSLKHHLLKTHKERLLRGGKEGSGDDWDDVTTPIAASKMGSKCASAVANTSFSKRKSKKKRKSIYRSGRKPNKLNGSMNAGGGGIDEGDGSLQGGTYSTISPTTRVQNNVASMTYEESLRIAMFEVDGRTYRVEIDEPLKLEFVNSEGKKEEIGTETGLAGSDKSVLSATNAQSSNAPSVNSSRASVAKPKANSSLKNKLPEAEVNWFHNYKPLKPHKVPKEYRQYKEKTAEELDQEVEYVMDDLDYSWLRMYNNEHRLQRGLPEVSQKDFELLMDRLEKDSRFEPNVMMNSNSSAGGLDGGGGVGLGGLDTSGLGFQDDDAVCSICQDGEANNTNVILFCDMCNLPVHQECYGVPYIPEGQWICRKCLLSPSQPVSCPLCPIKTGAFKQTSKNKWCHVSCAIWIPEVQFANAVFLEPIENLENIPAARFKLCCYICKKRNVGACVQCSKANCFTAFHIACGQSAGLHIKLEPIKDPEHSATLVNVKKVAYCDIHTPADSERKPLINSNADDKEDQKQNSKKLKQIFAQKQCGAVQVCLPEIPPEKYEAIVDKVSFPAKVQFLTRLTSYWLLRRQALNGVPLIKRLHMSHIQKQQQKAQAALDKCENDNEEIAEIKRTLKNLRDVRRVYEKARLLGEQVKKREKLKREWHQICEREFTLCTTSLYIILNQVMACLRDMDTQKYFIQPVDTKLVRDYLTVVDEPMDLGTMQTKIDNMNYTTIAEFSRDFSLVIHNCLRYNNRDTPFFKAAMRLRESGFKVIRHAYRFVNKIGIDPSTGMLTSKPPPLNHYNAVNLERALSYDPPPERYCDHIDYLSHFLDCATENKLSEDHVNLLKQVIDELTKGMLVWMDQDVQKRLKIKAGLVSPVKSKTKGNTVGAKRRKRNEDWRDSRSESKSNIQLMLTSPTRSSSRRSSSLFSANEDKDIITRTSAVIGTPTSDGERSSNRRRHPSSQSPASALLLRSSSISSNSNSEMSTETKLKKQTTNLKDPAVTTIRYHRSGSIVNPNADVKDEEATSSLDSGQQPQRSGADGGRDEDLDEEDDECIFQHMDFVWAKCRGFPSYPAIIIAPETVEGTKYNEIPIPVPPQKVVDSYEQQLKILVNANNLVANTISTATSNATQSSSSESNTKNSPKLLLVAFYETPTTWQWVSENQLEPLFTDEKLDEAKLEEPRKSVDKLKVRVAYSKAHRAYELFSGQRDPVEDYM